MNNDLLEFRRDLDNINKPVRKEFIVGDYHLVISNTLPEIDRNIVTYNNEFFCYYKLLCEKRGPEVSKSGTPAEVLNVLHIQEKRLMEIISKWEHIPILAEGYIKEKQAVIEFIKILSDIQNYLT